MVLSRAAFYANCNLQKTPTERESLPEIMGAGGQEETREQVEEFFLSISSIPKGGRVVFSYLIHLFQKVEELPEPDSVMACSQASDK